MARRSSPSARSAPGSVASTSCSGTCSRRASSLSSSTEAGPCGSWLSRSLTNKGYVCWVVAPSLMPTKAGDRVKTDRRDARQLARRHALRGPHARLRSSAVDDEAMRDRSRAREDTLRVCKRPRCGLNSFLCCGTISAPTGRANWSPPTCVGSAGRLSHPAPPHGLSGICPDGDRTPNASGVWTTNGTSRGTPGAAARRRRGAPGLRGVQCTVAVTRVAALGRPDALLIIP